MSAHVTVISTGPVHITTSTTKIEEISHISQLYEFINIPVVMQIKQYTSTAWIQGIKLTFFLVATCLRNMLKWQPLPKSWWPLWHTHKKSTFHTLINFHDKHDHNLHELQRTLQWVIYNTKGDLNPRWRLVMIDLSTKSSMAIVLRFGNRLNEELCCRFIFTNL